MLKYYKPLKQQASTRRWVVVSHCYKCFCCCSCIIIVIVVVQNICCSCFWVCCCFWKMLRDFFHNLLFWLSLVIFVAVIVTFVIPALLVNYDRTTDQRTDKRSHRGVILPISHQQFTIGICLIFPCCCCWYHCCCW